MAAEAHFGLKNYDAAQKCLIEVQAVYKGKLPKSIKSLANALEKAKGIQTEMKAADELEKAGKNVEAAAKLESLWRANSKETLAGVKALRLNLLAKRYARAATLAADMQNWLGKQQDQKSQVYLTQVQNVARQCQVLSATAKTLGVDASQPKPAAASAKPRSSSNGAATPSTKKSGSMADEFRQKSGK